MSTENHSHLELNPSPIALLITRLSQLRKVPRLLLLIPSQIGHRGINFQPPNVWEVLGIYRGNAQVPGPPEPHTPHCLFLCSIQPRVGKSTPGWTSRHSETALRNAPLDPFGIPCVLTALPVGMPSRVRHLPHVRTRPVATSEASTSRSLPHSQLARHRAPLPRGCGPVYSRRVNLPYFLPILSFLCLLICPDYTTPIPELQPRVTRTP